MDWNPHGVAKSQTWLSDFHFHLQQKFLSLVFTTAKKRKKELYIPFTTASGKPTGRVMWSVIIFSGEYNFLERRTDLYRITPVTKILPASELSKLFKCSTQTYWIRGFENKARNLHLNLVPRWPLHVQKLDKHWFRPSFKNTIKKNSQELMLSNCGGGEDSWEYPGLQGDLTGQSQRKSALNIHWKDWCWSWSSNTLATWCEEQTH